MTSKTLGGADGNAMLALADCAVGSDIPVPSLGRCPSGFSVYHDTVIQRTEASWAAEQLPPYALKKIRASQPSDD